MRTYKLLFKQIILSFSDTFCVILSFCFATFLRFGTNYKNMMPEGSFEEVLLIFILISLLTHFITDQSSDFMKRDIIQELKSSIIFNIIILFLLIFSFFLLHHSEYLSRIQLFYFLIINIPVLLFSREIIKKTAKRFYKNDNTRTNVIIISRKNDLENIMKNITIGTTYHICGTIAIDEGYAQGKINNIEVLIPSMNPENIPKNLVKHSFDEIFIYLPSYSLSYIEKLIKAFETMGVASHLVLPSNENKKIISFLNNFGGYNVISYSHIRPNQIKLAIKRFFDIIVSIVGLLITGVLLIFIGPAIKLDSKGPIFFTQTRVGKNGRKFEFYKFRSMINNAEEIKNNLSDKNEMSSDMMFKMEDDPRITKVGKFIRKTSIDEFPQFWNVLKGDMSVIGTRPPTVEEYEKYNEYYRRRLSMTPGITGLWQVSGRSEITDFNEVVKLDLEYIENWSLTLDLKIFLKTFKVLLERKGAK